MIFLMEHATARDTGYRFLSTATDTHAVRTRASSTENQWSPQMDILLTENVYMH